MKLNLGCGKNKIPGYLGVDISKTNATDIIHDLNKFPYPFKANSVDEILMDNVLEHLIDTVAVMEELHRISKNSAIIRIYVPYAKSDGAFTDPTHKRFFTEQSFKYFSDKNRLNYYSKARFEIKRNKLIQKINKNDLKYFLRQFIPFKSILRHFLFNIYDEIDFELTVKK